MGKRVRAGFRGSHCPFAFPRIYRSGDHLSITEYSSVQLGDLRNHRRRDAAVFWLICGSMQVTAKKSVGFHLASTKTIESIQELGKKEGSRCYSRGSGMSTRAGSVD